MRTIPHAIVRSFHAILAITLLLPAVFASCRDSDSIGALRDRGTGGLSGTGGVAGSGDTITTAGTATGGAAGSSDTASTGGAAGSSSPNVRCGDGVVQFPELCDDGNVLSSDGCSSDCMTVEPGAFCPVPGAPCLFANAGGPDGSVGTSDAIDSIGEVGRSLRFAQVSLGSTYTCGLKNDGQVACTGCWSAPQVGGLTQFSIGRWYNGCGLRADGTLACWVVASGACSVGGVGTPPTGAFIQVSSGSCFACGIRTDGTVACWGDNAKNQSTPPSGTFTQISAGDSHACGVKTDGKVACWGNSESGRTTPPFATFTKVAAGSTHTCGILDDSTVTCWGENTFGESSPPVGAFMQISAGGGRSCGVRTDGTAICWGDVVIPLPAGTYTQVATSYYHTCGVRTDGTIACVGCQTLDGCGMCVAPVVSPVL